MHQNAIDYHSRRATRELDLGLVAQATPVARAHLQLAALHLDRLRALSARLPHKLAVVD